MLWNSAKTVGCAWLIWVIPTALISVILIATGVVPQSELDPFLVESWWWFAPMILVLSWSVSTCLAAMLLAGRHRLMFALILLGFAIFLGLNLVAQFALSLDQQRLALWRVVFVSVAALVLLGTVMLFALARRRALIDTPTLWASLAAWCLLIAGLIATQVNNPQLPLSACLFVGCTLALTVAPLAGTPLALASNRIR